MKNIKKIVGTISFLLIAGMAFGQGNRNPYPDTLVVTTENDVDMKFLFYRISDRQEHLTDDLWESILSIMTTAVESSKDNQGVQVSYRKMSGENKEEYAQVEVKKLAGNSDIFIIKSDRMKEIRSNRIEYAIFLPKAAIVFSVVDTDDVAAIMDVSVESVWDQVTLKYTNEGKRNLYSGTGSFKYGKANISKITAENVGADNIELSAGVGLGFYRDRFIPDLNFKMAFNIPDRLGNTNLSFGALYTQQYLFQQDVDGTYPNADINGFLSGFFNVEFQEKAEVGIAAGMLIHRDGDFYKGGTYKFSLFAQKKDSKFDFTPELVFTNDFKQAFPALRFGMTF